jgi:predicted permease
MTGILHDLRHGLRQLRRTPGLTAAAVVTLALGIGANAAIYSVVEAVLLRPLPLPDPERVVVVEQVSREAQPLPLSPGNFVDFAARQDVFEAFGAAVARAVILTGGEPERLTGASASPGFLEVIAGTPLYGRLLRTSDAASGAEPVAVLGHELWKRRFAADPAVLGHTIAINDQPHTIVGIAPPGLDYPEGAEVWTPLVFEPGELLPAERNSHYLDVVARLAPGVTLERARGRLEAIARQLGEEYPISNAGFGARADSLHDRIIGPVRPSLLLLLGAVGFVLLIACANVANLLLARASARRREMAVRAALGAGRARLVRQLLTESLLLAAAGGAAGLAVAAWCLEAIRRLGPAEVPRLAEAGIDPGVLLFTGAASVATGILFGLAPALAGGRADLGLALREGDRAGERRSGKRLRAALVVAEVALSVVLLAGAGLMLRTLWVLVSTDPGFAPRGVLTATFFLPASRYDGAAQRAAFAERAVARLQALPGVEVAGATSHLPLAGGQLTYGFAIEGKPAPAAAGDPTAIPEADFRAVTPDYLRALRIPLRAGRGIAPADAAGAPPIALINEAAARTYWPGEDPLGHRIQIARGRGTPPWREIVGIVGDLRHEGLQVPPRPEVYVPLAQDPLPYFAVALRTAGDPAALAVPLREAMREIDADQPVSRLRPMAELVAAATSGTRFQGALLGAFAAVALALAAVGIYGVMAHAVAHRTREIGVRMALGAARSDIMRLVVGQGMRLAAAGIALGIGGALALTRLLSAQLFGVAPSDPATFACVTLALGAVALAACWLPARRATRVEPMAALRAE